MFKNELSHLEKSTVEKTFAELNELQSMACSLTDLQGAELPTYHSFELTQNRNTPMYRRPSRMTPRNYKIVEAEVQRILNADIIVPAPFARSFLVVMKKRGSESPFLVSSIVI